MISVVIITLNDERRLGGTLAPLVQAAVDGLVRQVIIADGGSTDATLEVADDAGAFIVKGGLAAGCNKAREPWLLVLDAGARLPFSWERVAHKHMQMSPSRAGRIEAETRGLGAWFGGRPVVGLLAPKAMVQGSPASLADLVKSVGRSRRSSLAIDAGLEP